MVRNRTLGVVAAGTLTLALSACNSGGTSHAASSAPAPSTSSQSSTSSTTTSSSSSASTAPATKKAAPTTTVTVPAAPASKGSGQPSTGTSATKTLSVAPDASWNIENSSDDLCAMGGQPTGSVSGFSLSGNAFTCGTTASSLLACTKDSGGNALCIVDYDSRRAVRFHTSLTKIDHTNSGSPTPLQATLTNGVVCSTISHDQMQHYDQRSSWLYCGDKGVLLLPKGESGSDGDGGAYFDKSKPQWTAQYSVNNAAPTTEGVASVVYAK